MSSSQSAPAATGRSSGEQAILDRVQQAVRQDSRNRELLDRHEELRRRLEALTPRERQVLDRVLRWLVVTPDMHRVHHSVEDDEANSNFGFNLPWWDRLFGTYRDQPRLGHAGMVIGIRTFRDIRQAAWLPGLLLMPFIGKITGYAINRRSWDDNDSG